MNDKEKLFNLMIEKKRMYEEASNLHWQKYELWTWQWWLDLILIAVPLIIWWKIVDRKNIYRIVAFGLLVNLCSTFLDILGSELLLWEYPIRIIPIVPRLLPIDYTVIPVTYMIVYQCFPRWKQYIAVSATVASIFSFVAEPLLAATGSYVLLSWRYVYSFPIYLTIAIVCKGLIQWFGRKKTGSAADG